MKVVVCGSMTFSKKMIEIEKELSKQGHGVTLPVFTKDYANSNSIEKMHSESTKNKINHNLIKSYFEEIKKADAILVVNEERHSIPCYIGGNTLIEMAFAHILNKRIFLLNGIPEMQYKDEIIAMQPVLLNNNLTKLK